LAETEYDRFYTNRLQREVKQADEEDFEQLARQVEDKSKGARLEYISGLFYSERDTPAMPLPIEHAHFGGFFYAWRSGLNMMIEELNEALAA
jgi:hypothetical protein